MDDFDWVSYRLAWAPENILEELRVGAERDCRAWRPVVLGREVAGVLSENGSFTVFVEASYGRGRNVTFRKTRGSGEIEVIRAGDSAPFLIGTPCFDQDGLCRLRTGAGDRLNFWQFRREALDSLFFPPPGERNAGEAQEVHF